MCLSLIVAVATGTLIVQPAAAEDCKFHSFQTTGDWEEVDSMEYTWCFIFPVVGTIKGQQLSCSNEGDVRTTNDIWGMAIPDSARTSGLLYSKQRRAKSMRTNGACSNSLLFLKARY